MTQATEKHGDVMKGLTSEEAAQALTKYGKNEVAEEEVSILWMFLKQFYGMMPACILICFVLAVIATDYIDCLFIGSLLMVNAVVGFREEYHAYLALKELIDSDVKTCRVKRDGKIYTQTNENGDTTGLPIDMLVPGDIISIKIGDVIPADCTILEGEIKMDTKAVTGEPIPWRVPRPTAAEAGNPKSKSKPSGYEVDEKGKELWGGCDVTNGECVALVIRTGATTIVGEVNAELAKKDVSRKSDFEVKILFAVKLIISVAAILSVLMALLQSLQRDQKTETALKALVALLIGSVPVALPLVLLVTMAMGSVTMSNEKALVSDLAALQDIASMTCLNSDKTGTLTTAVMEIITDRIHAEEDAGFTTEEILELSAVCSNRANADDAIDGAIIRAWDKLQGGTQVGEEKISKKWTVVSVKGFNNAAKRVECVATNKETNQTYTIVKGLIGKIIDNTNAPEEDEDNSHTRFKCKNCDEIKDRIGDLDAQLARDGWKTIGVGVRKGEGELFQVAGIVPMLDPPRDDASLCISMIREAGVHVKMVTGDHKNIAKTTAGIIGLGENILPNTVFSECSGAQLNKMVIEADGFAQVMPKDKETVVLEEQAAGWIVGMCGDGMNDALALNQAQVGIAVADAMDAAIKASAIQLLDPGLACIYTAIVESRKIFRRVKAYVTYRFAATIQVIVFLCVTLFVSGCQIDLIYIVILALLNDLTMMPLSSDRQKASKIPENPVVSKILTQAAMFGLAQAAISVGWFYIANEGSDWKFLNAVEDSHHIQPIVWNNYQFSHGGTDGPKAKEYDSCMAVMCPDYSCKVDDDGSLQDVKCLYQNVSKEATFENPLCYNTTEGVPLGIHLQAYCPAGQGVYNASTQKLPVWQECCVQYATLKHPGQPHYGDTGSVCTEITTISVFVQILVASELMIFPVRALGWMITSRASTSLYISVGLTIVTFCILAALGVPKDFGPLGDIFSQKLGWVNTGYAFAWSIGATLIMDCLKYSWVMLVDGNCEEIEDERVSDRQKKQAAAGAALPMSDSVTMAVDRVSVHYAQSDQVGGLQRPVRGTCPTSSAKSLATAYRRRGTSLW
jgi:H+-transporting ATPase